LVLFYFCPDWRTMQFQMDMPSLKGKMGLMPLPAWEPGGRRTSTWGATGLAFPKRGKNFELAWKLAMHLYFDAEQLGPRFAQTNILPPLVDSWTQPEFRAINAHWDMSLGEAFIKLAPQVPAAPTNAYHYVAISKLSKAFTKSSNYYAEHGEQGLREYTLAELKRAADEVRTVMQRNRFLNDVDADALAAGGAAK
jgi:arabinosaccharide transport system substrate-binding protein